MSFGFLRARSGAIPVLLALLIALPACDSSEPDEPGDGDEQGRVLFGVNYDRLFSDATAAEIQSVRDDWASRNPTSSNETVLGSTSTGIGTAFLVQHDVTTSGQSPITHYGVVHVPDGGDDLPVLVVHHGGDGGFSIAGSGANGTVTGFAATFPDLASSTVLVVPVYRSEPVLTEGTALAPVTAGGSPSPWDFDVDDSIAFLDAALELYADETDDSRIAAIGFSRGGNTAALHSIRDDRVDALVDYYGPTDFYNETTETLATRLLTGNAGALGLPGGQFLLDTVLNPLRNADGTANPDADYGPARLEVVRRSASLFEADLPDTQVHHHVNDPVVPIPFSIAFAARAEGGGGGSFEFFQYDSESNGNSFHSPEGFPSSVPVVTTFLRSQLAVGSIVSAPELELAY
ncbi:alpha/beta hydrolase family protein [Rubrivirga sp.]|uniref:alpha/beta hydrolase family protein n=1 Tax=Rubrivirga sp. TaxID=1885344 RepID=UPI003C72BB63